jgi:hypothetical protein
MGLGTCYVGAMRNDPERVAAELGLPPRAMALFGMCIGRADPARPAAVKPRLPQQAVAFRERYAPDDELPLVRQYDRHVAEFSRDQGMGDVNWSGRLLARMATIKGLNGRERMRAAMQALGFELR